ncbi:hypothetical protein [Streptomyces kebangsaanensis]|uniref:hypothetical protein n=1 Tax=Streptomyces kebangsaanensis TaxID=864058 RepID=UPI000AF35524|nr:hypothetical protein [Streptomyces kebangsaanensis]
MGIKSNNEMTKGCGVFAVIGVIALILAAATECGGGDGNSDAASTAKPSVTASVESPPASPTPEHTSPPASPTPERTSPSATPIPERPKKVTMTLAEIAGTPGTFKQFKKFVAENGTARQKEVVSHLKGWQGFRRGVGTGFPILEVKSDYPVIDMDAIDAGDEAELYLWMHLMVESQHAAEAFAAWWEADESDPRLQVFDREGEASYDSTCIDPHSVKNSGSCSKSGQ